MKKGIATLIVVLILMLGSAGCIEDWMLGAGAGAAAVSALDATETSLIQTGEELQTERIEAVQAVQDANTPAELSLAEKKLAVLDNSIFANKASLLTVQNLKAVAGEKTPEGRSDAIVTGVIGLGLLALKQWQLMIKNKKYSSMKIGQAKLKTVNPEAESQLYAFTGEARTAVGL